MSAVNRERNGQRSPSLERLAAARAREDELGRSERSLRMRSAAFGFLIGGLLGLFVGHMGLMILEAREEFLLDTYWTREIIAFDDQRPLIPTYFIGGGIAGALVSYQFFVLRSSTPSIRVWAIGALVFAIGSVFLIGYFASLMIVNFLDPVTGPTLDRGDPSAVLRFALSLFTSIPSSFGIMGGAFYVGFVGAGIFLVLWSGTKAALERTTHTRPLAGRIPFSAVIYFSAAVLASIPYVVSILGPDSTIESLVTLLSSLEI